MCRGQDQSSPETLRWEDGEAEELGPPPGIPAIFGWPAGAPGMLRVWPGEWGHCEREAPPACGAPSACSSADIQRGPCPPPATRPGECGGGRITCFFRREAGPLSPSQLHTHSAHWSWLGPTSILTCSHWKPVQAASPLQDHQLGEPLYSRPPPPPSHKKKKTASLHQLPCCSGPDPPETGDPCIQHIQASWGIGPLIK